MCAQQCMIWLCNCVGIRYDRFSHHVPSRFHSRLQQLYSLQSPPTAIAAIITSSLLWLFAHSAQIRGPLATVPLP